MEVNPIIPQRTRSNSGTASWPGLVPVASEILASQAKDGKVPTQIQITDWRYKWVQSTLRHLESINPVLQDEAKLSLSWLETGPDNVQLPPPILDLISTACQVSITLVSSCDPFLLCFIILSLTLCHMPLSLLIFGLIPFP